MTKRFFLFAILTFWTCIASAADLIEVYQQALVSDPTFQQAISQRLATKEGVPISVAAILPNIALTANPAISRYGYSGSSFQSVPVTDDINSIFPRNLTQRTYTLNLAITQTVFDFSKFSVVAQQVSLSSGADATLNASLQDLMTRVASAYFAILKDEDNLSYAEATKLAYAEQLDQIRQQYRVGLKTITDVYTAQASYDSAVAQYIAAENTLANDRENLRVITGIYYPNLASLSDKFPLIRPQPTRVELWVETAVRQNWTIRASRCDVAQAREFIKQQEAGHIPTLNVQGNLSRSYVENINGYRTFSDRNGPGTITDRSVTLNLNVPIFSGGGVIAQTNQAAYSYRVAQEKLELIIRNTINTTRQSYNSILSGISQVEADEQAIKSNISSLKGMEAGYQAGTQTLVDVLNQQENLFKAQTQYATDRYAFVNNILALKRAAGTLSFDDLQAINAWLTHRSKKKFRHA